MKDNFGKTLFRIKRKSSNKKELNIEILETIPNTIAEIKTVCITE